MQPNVVGFIFARGGSKGVPGKNIRPLEGKPLIGHAIDTALASRWIDRVIVSTDDLAIAEMARRYGAEVPFMRPAALAGDTAPELAAWAHAIETFNALPGERPLDTFVSIPTICPLRRPEDIDAVVDALHERGAEMAITVTESSHNPYFSMVVLDEQNRAELAMKPAAGTVSRRQDAPRMYNIVPAAYAARPDYVLHTKVLLGGRITAVPIPAERSVDIDSEIDFQLAELLIRQRMGESLHQTSPGGQRRAA